MRLLRTNWLFNSCQTGFWLLTALFFASFSFLWQATHLWQQLLIVVLLLYFGFLLSSRYSFAIKIILPLLLLLGSYSYQKHAASPFSLEPQSSFRIYPDQVKLRDNWLLATGDSQGEKVLLTGQLQKEQRQALLAGKTIYLSNLQGKVTAIPAATNFGEFDFRRYYASQGIKQKIIFTSATMKPAVADWRSLLHSWRYRVQCFCRRLPPRLGFFTGELLLAEDTRQGQVEIGNNYRNLGVIHLLSISGLHVALYTWLISSLCYCLKLTDKEAFIFCLLALLAEIWLSAGQAGFIRASLTYLISRLAAFKRWSLQRPDCLGLALCLQLLFNPLLLMNIGALLSYILTFGLDLTRHFTPFKQALCLNFLILPLLLTNFYQINLLAVFFNFLIVPYFEGIVMPIVLLNLALSWLWPKIGLVLEDSLRQGETIISWLAHSHLGLLNFGKISSAQTCFLLILTILALILSTEESQQKLSRQIKRLLLASYCCLFLLIHFPLHGQVTFIDVGQGDSILITTPLQRKVYLIDTGGKLNFTGHPVRPQIDKITLPFLKAQGISKIDGIFISHQDADHVGDLAPLLAAMPVKNLYVAKGLLTNPSFRRRLTGLRQETQIHELLAGDQIKSDNLSFQIVSPFHSGPGKNEDSLCLTFKILNKRWLFTGDLNQSGEKDLLDHYPDLRADYFKLGHHGSKTASNPEFLSRIKPEMVFISAGRHNRFGHPHRQTLLTLRKEGIPWASTQDCGMISWYYSLFKRPYFHCFVKERQS